MTAAGWQHNVLNPAIPDAQVQFELESCGTRTTALFKLGYQSALCDMQARLNAEKLDAQVPANEASSFSCAEKQSHSTILGSSDQTELVKADPKYLTLTKRVLGDSIIPLDATQPVKDETTPETDAFDGGHDLYYESQRREQAEKREYIRRELAEVLKRSEWLKESEADP